MTNHELWCPVRGVRVIFILSFSSRCDICLKGLGTVNSPNITDLLAELNITRFGNSNWRRNIMAKNLHSYCSKWEEKKNVTTCASNNKIEKCLAARLNHYHNVTIWEKCVWWKKMDVMKICHTSTWEKKTSESRKHIDGVKFYAACRHTSLLSWNCCLWFHFLLYMPMD